MAEIKEEKVARLKELMRIAKVKGFAHTQKDFANFIGCSFRTLQDVLTGVSANTDKYVAMAEVKLNEVGAVKTMSDSERLADLEKRVARLERALQLSDKTL